MVHVAYWIGKCECLMMLAVTQETGSLWAKKFACRMALQASLSELVPACAVSLLRAPLNR